MFNYAFAFAKQLAERELVKIETRLVTEELERLLDEADDYLDPFN